MNHVNMHSPKVIHTSMPSGNCSSANRRMWIASRHIALGMLDTDDDAVVLHALYVPTRVAAHRAALIGCQL